jgi:cation:H+ antiporter
MNAMLIVGAAALVAPMVISPSTVKKDIPCSVLASILLVVLAFDGALGRFDGIILLLGFAAFMAYTLMQAKTGTSDVVKESSPVWKNILFVVFGLTGLVVGSNLFVDAASGIALSLGISEAVVGLTIVAGGTSLPELATSVVAARKGQSAIAIGNVIGSNVFNILLILGLTATINPLEIEGITTVDMAVMLLSVALIWLFSRTRYTVERWEGAVLLLGYMAYLWWLITSL